MKNLKKLQKEFLYIMNNVEGKYQADAWEPKVTINTTLELTPEWSNFNPFQGITINLFTMAIAIHKKKGTALCPDLLGELFVENLAHEWRHNQQQLSWDMPQVAQNSMRLAGSTEISDGYWEDPGEIDAREFARLVVETVDKKHIKAAGRLMCIIIKKLQKGTGK